MDVKAKFYPIWAENVSGYPFMGKNVFVVDCAALCVFVDIIVQKNVLHS